MGLQCRLTMRDANNDELTDLEEFAIGTNPVHWETDVDGLDDAWESVGGDAVGNARNAWPTTWPV